jgi:hypothetical protein
MGKELKRKKRKEKDCIDQAPRVSSEQSISSISSCRSWNKSYSFYLHD